MKPPDSPPQAFVTGCLQWCVAAGRAHLEAASVRVLAAGLCNDPGLNARISETPGEPVAFVCPSPSDRHLAGLEQLLRQQPSTPVAAFATEPNAAVGRKVRDLGAHGYSHFDAAAEETVALFARLAVGGTWFEAFDPVAAPQRQGGGEPGDLANRLNRLTRRERQVMALLGQGYANREIAEALGLREGTIRIYVHRVIRQLGMRNRVDVALCASRMRKTA